MSQAPSVLWRKLLRDLGERKLALGTLVGILAVGIGCFVGPASLHRDLTRARDRYYHEQRLAHLLVELEHAPRRVLDPLREVPNLRTLRDRLSLPLLVDLPAHPEPLTGVAYSMPTGHPPRLHDAYLTGGQWFSHPEAAEAVLNHQFAKAHGLAPGDRLAVNLEGRREELLVVGTALDPQFVWIVPPGGGLAPDPARYAILYLPRRFLARRARKEGAFNQLLVELEDASPARAAHTLSHLESRLEPYGVLTSSRIEENASVKMLADEIDGLEVTTRTIPLIFLAVAALVLHVVMGRLVVQQRSLIGTLKALGVSRGALIRHYLGFAVAVGGAGGLGGILVGAAQEASTLPIYAEMFAMPGIQAHPAPDLWLLGLFVGVAFAGLGASVSLLRALRLDPAESMRPPPPAAGRRVLPERWPGLWRRLGFRSKLVIRSLFRHPFRNGVNVVATFFATSLILATLSLTDSVDEMMDFTFRRIRHEDLSLSLRDPVGPEVLAELAALPGVSLAEGQLSVAADLVHGSRRKRLGVQGLPPGGRLHTPVDRRGRPLVVPEQGLVLTRKLAEILDVGPGDEVELRPLIGHRRRARIRVAAVTESFLGLSAYADVRTLSRLLGEELVLNEVLLSLRTGVPPEALGRELRERPGVVGLGERRRALTHLQETFGQVQLVSLVVLVVFAGMIAFGSVLNIALVTLDERLREVATFRVLGYQPEDVARMLRLESAALNGLGGLLGLGGGWALTHLLSRAFDTELYRFPASVAPVRVLQTGLTMALFVWLAQGVVARLIRRLEWIEALSIKE